MKFSHTIEKNKKIKQITKHILMLVICSSIYSAFCNAFEFNEIMFNPNGSDTGREWIEIKTGGECINFTKYKLFEEETNHNIYRYNQEIACEYAIICNDINKFLEDHPDLGITLGSINLNGSYSGSYNITNITNVTLYRSAFSLSNTGEELAIKEGTEFLAYINYSVILSFIQVTEGHSLEYFDDAWRNSDSYGGTPGRDEEANIQPINETIHNETVNETIEIPINETDIITEINNMTTNDTIIEEMTNITDSSIINNTIINNITGNDTIINNNTIDNSGNNHINDSITNNTDNNINSTKNECSVFINITIKNESSIYENGVQVKFYNKLTFDNKLNYLNYSIEYWVEDLDGKIFKNKILTDNQAEKTFTPKIDESDKILVIKNSIKDAGECMITSKNSEKILLIRNPSYTEMTCPQQKSTCEIDKKTECKACICDIPYTSSKNCSQKPIMNINVCNCTASNHTMNKGLQEERTETNTSKDINLYDIQSTQYPNSTLKNSKTSVNGQTTGMIIYESPNIKNRFYAVIGFMLVGLTVLGKTGHTFFKRFKKRHEQ
jgi:hypothetical protein